LAAELLLLPLRWSNAAALLLHGFGHALALFLATGKPAAFSGAVIRENLSPAELAASLLPFQPLPQFSAHPPRLRIALDSAAQRRIVAGGGIAMNMFSLACVWAYGPELAEIALLAGIALACFSLSSLLAMLSWPDLLALRSGTAASLACGPAFAVRYRPSAEEIQGTLASERLRAMVEVLAREASTRGGQSGGFALLTQKAGAPSIVFDKAVKGKREDIVNVLEHKLSGLLAKAGREGYTAPGDFEALLLHLRYATGGATHWHNAQPHWYEHFDAMTHHRVENGRLASHFGEVFNMIAHNGDMDGVHLEFSVDGQRVRQYFSQLEARAVFLAAMPASTSQGNSDSRSVAEWVDFVYTQGLAYKALRYAYFTAVLDFNRDICQGRFDLYRLYTWAEHIDLALGKLRGAGDEACLKPQAHSIADLTDSAKQTVRGALRAAIGNGMDDATAERFIAAFETAFYTHDLAWVMGCASRDLVGEFALMVCTTLEPRLGVFSLTQAFSIGHNRSTGEIFGGAEPQGVTSALQRGSADDDALQIYLADGQYATVEYRPQPGQDPVRIYQRAAADDDLSCLPEPAPGTRLENKTQRCEWFAVNRNPKIDRHNRPDAPGREIQRDIRDIPYALRRVIASFAPGGENHATMEHFAGLLWQNLLDPRRDAGKHDLVLFGVDFNQDLVGEFALALRSVLPGLNIRAENSGNVLKEMKRTRREGIGRYGEKTLFLGVSNSAQTQSTLAAIRKARELVGAERCFVLSQSCLNSMSQALGQGYHPEDPLLPNTFVNLSHWAADGSCGRRRAEAATLVPVATQAVLTEILIQLAQRALELRAEMARNGEHANLELLEIRHDLQWVDIQAFRDFQTAVYEVEIPNRVGCNAAGQAIAAPDTEALEREARARAENTIEFVRSYALFAAYIVVATLFGVPVFAVLSAPFQSIAGVPMLAHVLDAALFLSALWLIHCGIRYCQGRPVLERIGARAELYIDRRYIARMVERYNATLFSNAPAFITPFFYWADTVQDALHRFGIRSHRGVVTIHRTPDERLGIEEANNAAEENMVFAQIGGIRFNHGQPQSRDKVRHGSCYMNRNARDQAARPYQTVLSDSLEPLRRKYDRKLSPETLRLINRRLIDLADGLIVEFVLGERRKELVNQAVWEVVRWIPGAGWIYQALLAHGIDLMNLAGEADTANQAQIQSTKHPVSPMDIHVDTMAPRATLASFNQEIQVTGNSLGVFALHGDALSLTVEQAALPGKAALPPAEIRLKPGKGLDRHTLVSDSRDKQAGRFVGVLQRIDGEEHLVIANPRQHLCISLPLSCLPSEQRGFLHRHLAPGNQETWAEAA
jgi:hypothetical protein